MRLIDADKLLEELKKTDRYFIVKFDIENAPTVTSYEIEALMSDYLTFRLEPQRPQGTWIFEKANEERIDGYICSNCKCSFHTRVPYFSEFNFCPNCGAEMKKGGQE